MSTAVFCNKCVPAGGVEDFTIGFIGTPKCDRCGCECGPDNRHVGRESRLWPRAIPVSEGLPEVGEYANWFFQDEWWQGRLGVFQTDNSPDWKVGDYYIDELGCCQDLQILKNGVTHWMPEIPKPE